MSGEQHVFIAVEGIDSDFRIVACFDTLWSAQQYCRTVRRNETLRGIESREQDLRLQRAWLEHFADGGPEPSETVYEVTTHWIRVRDEGPYARSLEWITDRGWAPHSREEELAIARTRTISALQYRIGIDEDTLARERASLEALATHDFVDDLYDSLRIERHVLWNDPVPALEARDDE